MIISIFYSPNSNFYRDTTDGGHKIDKEVVVGFKFIFCFNDPIMKYKNLIYNNNVV